MSKIIVTKEGLIKENAHYQLKVHNLEDMLEARRQDLCRVLGFKTVESMYGSRSEKILDKTWAEIFAEIGRLKAVQDIRNVEEMMRNTENHVANLEKSMVELSGIKS